MVLRPGVGGIPGLFDGAQKKVAVPLKFRGRKAVVGLHAWVLGGEKMKPVLEIKDLDKKFVGVHAVDHVSLLSRYRSCIAGRKWRWKKYNSENVVGTVSA